MNVDAVQKSISILLAVRTKRKDRNL